MTLFDAMADPDRHDAFHFDVPDLDTAGTENVAGRTGTECRGIPSQIPVQTAPPAPAFG